MLNIIYDATQIVSGETDNNSRCGIYVTSLNILNELLKRDDVRVHLWTPSNKSYLVESLRLKYFPKAINYYNERKISKILFNLALNIKDAARKKQKHFILRKVLWLAFFVVDFLNSCASYQRNGSLVNDENTVFFSPLTAAPWYFGRRKSLRKYVVLYDIIPYKLQSYNSQIRRGWFGNLVKKLNPSDYYFSISQATKKDFCDAFPRLKEENVWVVYLAASNSFKQNEDVEAVRRVKAKYKLPSNKYIFSLCTLEPRKNLIRAVKTFLEFVQKHRIDDLVWVMGGAQWSRFSETIKKEICNAELFDEYVFYAGYIDDEDLPVLYSNAEWFVYTSQYEGFGLPPLEAMQCGCPVITSNNSSLPEVVGDAGIMIDWDSDEQHIAAYEKYYFNEELRKGNSRKGLERAKHFSWKLTTDKMMYIMTN